MPNGFYRNGTNGFASFCPNTPRNPFLFGHRFRCFGLFRHLANNIAPLAGRRKIFPYELNQLPAPVRETKVRPPTGTFTQACRAALPTPYRPPRLPETEDRHPSRANRLEEQAPRSYDGTTFSRTM